MYVIKKKDAVRGREWMERGKVRWKGGNEEGTMEMMSKGREINNKAQKVKKLRGKT